MEEQGDGNPSTRRWTCEACGCNTNQPSDTSCTICGTSNSGPSILRRGGPAGYAARAGWFARGVVGAARRNAGSMHVDDLGMEDDDIWDSVVDGVELGGHHGQHSGGALSAVDNDSESAMDSLALEVSGMASAARHRFESSRHGLESSRQRFLEAARAFSQGSRSAAAEPPRLDAAELLRSATVNARNYRPRWANPATMLPRVRVGNAIEVGEGERQSLAHLPTGAGEGRAVRAEEPLPRAELFGSFGISSPSSPMNANNGGDAAQRRCFGFRVAFDHPAMETHANMGGCYLVGVTTSSFTAYGEQNGLQQSPFFWGIEDGGHKYEGSRYTQQPSARGSARRVSSANYAIELGPHEAPLNISGVLFGCREVVTVVCDLERRTLTFWRDDTLLGTLVTNLPRGGNLFPVAVPFNCGVTVAITGLDSDPLPLLQTFATDWRKVQQEKDDARRQQIAIQRAMLIANGLPTIGLIATLKQIFCLYARDKRSFELEPADSICLDYNGAARLWYRCGLKLANLEAILEAKSAAGGTAEITFADFVNVIEKVVEEDEAFMRTNLSLGAARHASSCEVGDKVELVEGYEKCGDAASGPLQVGDRGIVVELQRGPNGERRSIRVLHNGRRWWYQPQAILSERSGLIESPGVWFLRGVLRWHGYDPTTLESMWSKPVTPSSWCVGDVVIPKKPHSATDTSSYTNPMESAAGVIIAETSTATAAMGAQGRESGNVTVEFISSAFADALGTATPNNSLTLETRRVRVSKLSHSSVFHGSLFDPVSLFSPCSDDNEMDVEALPDGKIKEDSTADTDASSDKIRSEIAALARLERPAIENITKACKKSAESLACMFSAGLPDALIAAMDVAERQMNSLEPREDLAEKIAASGALALFISDQLFSETPIKQPAALPEPQAQEDENETSSSQPTGLSARARAAGRRLSNADRRQLARDTVVRRDNRREEDRTVDPQGLAASLQHRRSMLLNLMSRARRSNASYLNDMAELGNVGLPRDLALGALHPHLGPMRAAQPFVFGAPGELMQDGSWEEAAAFAGGATSNPPAALNGAMDYDDDLSAIMDVPLGRGSFLDSILRCRCDAKSVQGAGKVTSQSSFARHIIMNGILYDSFLWVKASIDSHARKNQLTTIQRSQLLRNVVDDEGTPLLQLAITFGCSLDIISHLIAAGAPVSEAELKKAIMTDSARCLALLLRHAAYPDDLVDKRKCTAGVLQVLDQAQARQHELDRKMRNDAGTFMVKFLRKLLRLGLSSRRHQSPSLAMCSRSISEILVGNVLLRALQKTQKAAVTGSRDEPAEHRDVSDRSGRFSVEDSCPDLNLCLQGLLGSLPQEVLREALLGDTDSATTCLLLIEDYLCSKEMSDAASGLTFLSMLLSKFPGLRSSSEMSRYGMPDLVSFHDVLASSRFAEILSRQLSDGLDVSSSSSNSSDAPRLHRAAAPSANESANSVVLCPKKHTAVLHVTRHSSFRCDLCGNGVERGRPMHGCRECDWDACEDCTDKAESGLVKCSAIKDLAVACQRFLGGGSMKDQGEHQAEFTFEKLSCLDTSTSLNELTIHLLQREPAAARELVTMLDTPGCVTVHQFLTVILPALHAACVGSPSESEGLDHAGSGHRSKKARVVDGPFRDPDDACFDSPEERAAFCREIVNVLVAKRKESSRVTSAGTPNVSNSGPNETGEAASVDSNEFDDDEDNEMIKEKTPSANSGKYLANAVGSSELLRRLQQVLSLYESVPLVPSLTEKRSSSSAQGGDLHALTRPLEIKLAPSAFGETEKSQFQLSIHAEPLIPISDLQLLILRTYRLSDQSYISFCHGLARDKAIIVEKPARPRGNEWKLAQIIGFDESTGSHTVRYADSWRRPQDRRLLRITESNTDDVQCVSYNGSVTKLVLAAREYFVIHRSNAGGTEQAIAAPLDSRASEPCDSTADHVDGLRDAIGSRVESDFVTRNNWDTFTLVAVDSSFGRSSHCGTDKRFVLVSDDGVVHCGVPAGRIRLLGRRSPEELGRDDVRTAARRAREGRDVLNRAFPFLTARQRPDLSRETEGSSPDSVVIGALRRSWSALSLAESMRPVELNVHEETKQSSHDTTLRQFITCVCKIGNDEVQVISEPTAIEMPPVLSLKFSAHEKLPGIDLSRSSESTLIAALKILHERHQKWQEWPLKNSIKLFFSVDCTLSSKHNEFGVSAVQNSFQANSVSTIIDINKSWRFPEQENRSRKLSARSPVNEEEETAGGLCEGLDEICIQCMEVISLISEFAEDSSLTWDREQPAPSGFANNTLSKKLAEQLDDPVSVVGGALPDWCKAAPSFAPRVFSYESRRMFLERAAFGVSRSTLKQQEAKVNVGRYRQRMAALRARAVELVGEAFSGGAEDPTALQLQADELYGMEETLAARVRQSFRAAKWQEHSLQVAKAAVRRHRLLSDAASVMERYANDELVYRRRLEVRFEGESGFDAASGDEAGVTRGFYADVAEALLSCDHAAGVYCSTSCSYVPATASKAKIQPVDLEEVQKEASKLPLWIPDMDTSGQVVIPSPRADERSGLGVYPRPLPTYHPQITDVLQRFRFIGRLFAAAMRDGFMFPLPLSSAFLKLVQHGSDLNTPKNASRDGFGCPNDILLTSADLPRPGFLGGEIYAADVHICRALDRVDSADPPLSRYELQRRYEEIAADKNFARVALGKSYDCSFEDFFQDRTFVDPLDPAQGEDAVPLCPNGHRKNVTIYNIREWVALAKIFFLHDGVLAQALAFRDGIQDFFPADYLRLFTSVELQRDVCGVGDSVDSWDESAVRKLFKLDGGKGAAEALVAVAAIGGEGGAALSRRFGPSSPTISFLVKALLDASPKQRRQFLSFVTSLPIVTPGRIEVVPMVSPGGEFLPMADPGCLPRANTCARRLYLPKFESYESFSQVLWAVVREESKFKGFYEWRGS